MTARPDRVREILDRLSEIDRRLTELPPEREAAGLAGVLEERDRQIAALHREADNRLAALNTAVADAEERLKLLEWTTKELEQAQAENAVLSEAAAARLEALMVNAAAVISLQQELAKYQ